MLLQSTNLPLNESYYMKQLSYHAKQTILNIITDQRKRIEKLDDELSKIGQPLGVVKILKVDENLYKLIYSNHYIPSDSSTAWIYETYNSRYIYEQIRDYIDEYEPKYCQVIQQTYDPEGRLSVLLNIKSMSETVELLYQIVNHKAPMRPYVKNKAYIYQHIQPTTYIRVIAAELDALPYIHVSNYYLRQFGYFNKDPMVYIGAVNIKAHRLIFTIDSITPTDDDYVESVIENNLLGFLNDLNNWRKYDNSYTYEIVCKKNRYQRIVSELLEKLPDSELQPEKISVIGL